MVDGVETATAAGHQGIVARAVRRTFGEVVAIDHIDLDAPPGHITALVGPNGAGKTTLMLILGTLLAPDSGQVWVAGHDPVQEPRAVRAQLGWMPDSFGTYDTLTVDAVLRFFAAAYRIPTAHHTGRIGELLELVHLAEFRSRPVHVLSKGQKQRLGLARALIHNPSVLILDEPAAGLDPRSRIELRAILRHLAAQGRTILISSHILAELEEMVDRVVFVDRGRTVGQQQINDIPQTQQRAWRLHSLDDAQLVRVLDEWQLTRAQQERTGVDVMLGSEADAANLIARLVGAGVPLVSCAPAGSALESAYLEMTENRR